MTSNLHKALPAVLAGRNYASMARLMHVTVKFWVGTRRGNKLVGVIRYNDYFIVSIAYSIIFTCEENATRHYKGSRKIF